MIQQGNDLTLIWTITDPRGIGVDLSAFDTYEVLIDSDYSNNVVKANTSAQGSELTFVFKAKDQIATGYYSLIFNATQGGKGFKVEAPRVIELEGARAKKAETGDANNILRVTSTLAVYLGGSNGVSPYIGVNGNWWEFSDETRTFVDTGIKADYTGENDAAMAELEAATDAAVLINTSIQKDEVARVANEDARIVDEGVRKSNEAECVSAEAARDAKYNQINTAEQERVQNEQGRVINEGERVSGETQREANEADRTKQFASMKTEVESATATAIAAGNTALTQGNAAAAQGTKAESQGNTAATQGSTAATQGSTAATQGSDAKAKGDAAKTQGDYAKTQGDYAKTQGNDARTKADAAKTQGDYAKTQGSYAKTQGDYAKSEAGKVAGDIANLKTGKLDKPTNAGETGMILTKTATGSEWQPSKGGGSSASGYYGLGFKPGDNSVNLATKPINLGTKDFTLELWARMDGCGSTPRTGMPINPTDMTGEALISFVTSGGNNIDTLMTSKGNLSIGKMDATSNLHHIILTHTGLVMTVIVNGRLIKVLVQTSTQYLMDFKLIIGCSSYFSLGRVFGYCMSNNEAISMLWNGGRVDEVVLNEATKRRCLLELLPQNIHPKGIYNTGSLGSSHDAVLSNPAQTKFIKEPQYKDKQIITDAPTFHPIAMGQECTDQKTGSVYKASVPPPGEEWSEKQWRQINR